VFVLIISQTFKDMDMWQKSLELTGSKDRINLRKAYHNFGQYLELTGDRTGAIVAYEKAGTHT
jgi:hypothetical protein